MLKFSNLPSLVSPLLSLIDLRGFDDLLMSTLLFLDRFLLLVLELIRFFGSFMMLSVEFSLVFRFE